MATFTVDQVVNAGLSLVAAKQVTLYSYPPYPGYESTSHIVGVKQPGETIGVVYSYVGGDNRPLYWMFLDGSGSAYFVLHDPSAFNGDSIQIQFQAAGMESIQQQAIDAAEAKKKDDMGAFAYYVQKWGGTVLMCAVGLVVFTEYMKHNKKK